MRISKERALDALKRSGGHELIEDARRTLPDDIDVDRDGHLLDRFGLSIERLTDRLGGSP